MENFGDHQSLVNVNPQSQPYAVRYKNNSKEPKKCYFLGYSVFCGQDNFGNDKDVEIINLCGSTYGHVVSEVALKPIKSGVIRVTSKKLIDKFTVNHHTGGGELYQIVQLVLLDPYQFQVDIVQINKEHCLDGNSYLAFELEPEQEIILTLYPISRVSLTSLLKGMFNVFSGPVPRLAVAVQPKHPVLFWFQTKWHQLGFYLKKLFGKKPAQAIGSPNIFKTNEGPEYFG